MAINAEIRRSNAVNYAEVIHFKTNVGLVEGLLDLNGKIKSDFIPGYVLGSMRFGGVINSSGSLKEKVEEFINAETKDTSLGLYFICTADITLERTNPSTDPKSHGYIINVAGLEGGNNPASLESGDWIIYNRFDETFTVPTIIYTFSFDVINNTYRDATTTTKGIVQLASDTDGETGTNTTKAMTPKATVAAINKRAYVHPTHTAKNETFSAVETLSALSVNSLGHVTSFAKQAIRVASEAQTGVIRLASSSEAKAATDDTKATSPLRVKEMIDKFASIPIVQSLPTDMSDHPAGKLIMLQL